MRDNEAAARGLALVFAHRRRRNALPRCVRCRLPTEHEALDPYWQEAGELMCEDCSEPERTERQGRRNNRPDRRRNRQRGA